MNSKTALTAVGCLAILMLSATPQIFAGKAAPTPSPSASATASPSASQSNRPVSYHGRISALDPNAKTFTITGKRDSRVIKITDQTRITKDDAPDTMNDLQVGAMVHGSYWKKSDGSLEAKSVKIGGNRAKARGNPAIAPSAPTPTATP